MPDPHTAILTANQRETLKAFRRRLLLLGLISAGIDIAIFSLEVPLIITFLGASLVLDELIEWVISSLIAKNKMTLKKRYKIAGLIPLPGFTSLSLQTAVELIASYRAPHKVLARLES
jgi:hypothetical protein